MASIIIPTNDNPTPASRKAWVGAVWGDLIAAIPAAIVAAFINPILGAGVALAGIAGGYFIGKSKGEDLKAKELREGKKEVKEPTLWNRGLAKGWIISTLINLPIAVLNKTVLSGNLAIGLGMSFVGSLIGLGVMIAGSSNTKREMRAEYAQAQQIAEAERQKEITKAVEKARAAQPEVAQTPQTEPAKFTQAEDERRAKAQQTQVTPP